MILIMKTRTKVIIAIGSNRNQEENVLKAHEYLRCMFKNSLFGCLLYKSDAADEL